MSNDQIAHRVVFFILRFRQFRLSGKGPAVRKGLGAKARVRTCEALGDMIDSNSLARDGTDDRSPLFLIPLYRLARCRKFNNIKLLIMPFELPTASGLKPLDQDDFGLNRSDISVIYSMSWSGGGRKIRIHFSSSRSSPALFVVVCSA
jgi:hypothetical protein